MNEKTLQFEGDNPTLDLYNQIMDNAYDTTNILAKTELSGKEIALYAYGSFLAKLTKSDIITQYMEDLLIGKLSLKRQSRKEADDISKALLQSSQQSQQPPTMMEHLFGTRKY